MNVYLIVKRNSMLEIDFLNIDKPVFLEELENFCLASMEECGIENRDLVELILTENETIKSLNKLYRGKNEATDVLSFSLKDDLDGNWHGVDEDTTSLGSIIISLPMLKTNAEYFNVSQNDELKRLVVHGILHLLGHDHQTNNHEVEDMLIKQEKILQKFKNYVIIKE